MIFNSVTFLGFLLLVVALYWGLPRRPRLWMLFGASLVFYGFWRVEFLPLMLFSTYVDYLASLRISKASTARARKAWLGVSLAVNLGLLFVFKYLLFVVDNAYFVAGLIGYEPDPFLLNIILPIGISFYTFQTISYTVDVYRGFAEPEREFVLYACYVTFFPQLVAGPVLRVNEVLPQLSARPRFDLDDIANGVRRIVMGLFLKVALADNIAPLVDAGYATDPAFLSALDVWTLAFLFGLQIYFDFSAYSHIAIGCARLMGISFPENFDYPYAAVSPRDFWRRWHISLSSWIRDYLYLPLAGAQVRDRSTGGLAVATDEPGVRRQNVALFATWAIMGLWHGANWTFVFWGVYHAVFIFLYRRTERLRTAISDRTGPVFPWLGWAFTLPLMMLSWVPFRADSMPVAFELMRKIVDVSQYTYLGLNENIYLVSAVLLVLTMLSYLVYRFGLPVLTARPVARLALESVVLAVMIVNIVIFLRPITQFIYFQF